MILHSLMLVRCGCHGYVDGDDLIVVVMKERNEDLGFLEKNEQRNRSCLDLFQHENDGGVFLKSDDLISNLVHRVVLFFQHDL